MIPDKLFINLKILSKIQKNGRITRSYDGIISLENENFFQSLKRFVSSDSRKQSVFEINSIINECTDIFNNIINSKYMNNMCIDKDEYYKYCEDLALLLKELEPAKGGIENLKFTYKPDNNIACQLDIIVIKMNAIIKDIVHKLNYYQSFLPLNKQTQFKEFLIENKNEPQKMQIHTENLQPITQSIPITTPITQITHMKPMTATTPITPMEIPKGPYSSPSSSHSSEHLPIMDNISEYFK